MRYLVLALIVTGCAYAHPCDCKPDAHFEQDGHTWYGYRITEKGKRFSTTWEIVHDTTCTNAIHHKHEATP